MFTKINTKAIAFGTAVLLTAGSLGACGEGESATTIAAAEPVATTSVAPEASFSDNASMISDVVDTAPVAEQLTADEVDAIMLMREEEKLAQDVYSTLGDIWGLRIFENIAASETTHTGAVAMLIDRYDLEDPAAGNDIGEFTDPDFKVLYDDLVERGSESLVEALAVGAFIEDLDIVDLERLLEVVDTPAVTSVFESLLKASRNHLRSFTSQLESRGTTYSPEFLTQAEYDAIISTPTERGRA